MPSTGKLQQQSEHTRARLLQAARELFFSRGYAGVSIQEICEKAGVTKGAFYHHFSGKDAVYRSLFTAHLDLYLESHGPVPPQAGARARFQMLAQCTFHLAQELGRSMMAQDMIQLLTGRASNLYREERIHTRLLDEAIAAGLREHPLRAGLARDHTVMLYACLMNGFLVKWISASEEDDARIDWEALLCEEIALLTRGPAPDQAG